MRIGSTRPRRALAICAGLLAGQALLVTLPAPAVSDRSCSALREWARPYIGTAPTLDQVAQFDRAHRLAIFNAVTPDLRAVLWREQLRRFALRDDLSHEQRAFVGAARADLVPALYEQVDASASRERARQFWATAAPLFPSREHQRAWFDLGSVVASAPRPAQAGLMERLAAPFTAGAQAPWCECSGEWGWVECYPGNCYGSLCAEYWGCGPEGMSLCAGMCF